MKKTGLLINVVSLSHTYACAQAHPHIHTEFKCIIQKAKLFLKLKRSYDHLTLNDSLVIDQHSQ